MGVVTLFTLFYPKREILFFFVPMPMWVLLAIYLFFPLLPGANGGSAQIAVESHLAGAAFAALYWKLDLRWSHLFTGRPFRPRLRIFSPVAYDQAGRELPAPRAPQRSSAAPARPPRSPSCPRSSSMPGSMKSSPKSPGKGVPD